MLEAILFDFDGTIAETERLGHRVAYNTTFAQLGLPWTWDEALYGELLSIGGGKERIAHFLDRYAPAGAPAVGRDAFITMVHERKQQVFSGLIAGIRVRPGVRRLISEARDAGVRVAIATTAARAGVDALIARDEILRDAFSTIAAGDIVPHKKPAPDIYTYTLDALGLRAEHGVAVEDSAIGTRSAVAAGLVTLVTVSDYTRGEDFTGAAAVLSDLGEPEMHATSLAGPAPARGYADLTFVRELLVAR